MDAYRVGLNGKEAIWAARKYRSHRGLPPSAFEEVKLAFQEKKSLSGNVKVGDIQR